MYVVKPAKNRSDQPATALGAPRPAKRMSRQEARTAATRNKLLAAAGRIFARDGFEAARLEDIAAAAGYTRGAFYANFNDKEDLFFALLERWVGERMAEVNALLAGKQSPQERLRALRGYYAQSAKDRHLTLLSLEFTLYAIRHPDAHARLRIRMRRLRACGAETIRSIAKAKGLPQPVPPIAAAAALSAFSKALFLEHVVDPKALTDADVSHLLGAFFDAVVD
jgi:AcrR family transcriptional regulator